MPQISAALTINNGAAVAKTFSISKVTPEDSLFLEKTASPNGTANGYTRLRVRHTPPAGSSRTYKSNFDIDLPTVATVDSKDVVLRTQLARVQFVTTDDATQTERDNLVAYVINGLSNGSIKPVFQSNDPQY